MPQYPPNPFGFAKSIPVIGPDIARLGHVSQILMTPGPDSLGVWVEAGWVALPRFVYTFVKPFFWAWEFYARGGRPCGPRRKLKGIARLINEVSPKAPITQSPAWAFFELPTELVLKAEWYFFLADRTSEFLVNWTSMAYAINGNEFPGGDFIFGNAPPQAEIVYPDPRPAAYYDFNSNHGFLGRGGYLGVPAGESGSIHYSFSGHGERIDGLDKCDGFSTQLVDEALGPISAPIEATPGIDGGIGTTHVHIIDGTLTEGHTYYVAIAGKYGFLRVDNATLSWYGYHTGKKGLLFDP